MKNALESSLYVYSGAAHCTLHIDVIITLISTLAILNRHKNSDELFDTRASLIKIPRSSHFPNDFSTKLTLDS